METLTIGQDNATGKPFRLPLETVTQSIAILAKRGVGKTYTAAVLVEELLAQGQVPIIIDPTGAHWGLKASADGKDAAFPVVIFGGEHADLPLEEGSGEAIARAIVEQRFPAIIDLSDLKKGAVRRFMPVFLETLYLLNRLPLMLVVDEADDLCPQKPFGDEARMVGAMEDVVKRGRKKGLGVTLITQRPADLAKQVLTQCEILIAMRLVHPLDIKAVMEWVHVHADTERAAQMVTSLPSLPVGTAWIWSPGFGDIFDRIQIRKRRTFDSSATPKAGQKQIKPRELAKVDLTKLGAAITAAQQRAKENDPAALKKKVAELERSLEKMLLSAVQEAKIEIQQVPMMTDADRGLIQSAINTFENTANSLKKFRDDVEERLRLCEKNQKSRIIKTRPEPDKLVLKKEKDFVSAPANVSSIQQRIDSYGEKHTDDGRPFEIGTGGKRRILNALAQYPDGTSKRRLSLLTGISSTGGTWRTYLGELRGAGFISSGSETIWITKEGRIALGPFQPLPTGEALRDYWRSRLGDSGKRKIFDAVVAAYPNPIHKLDVSEKTGISTEGGTWRTYLGELRGLELITGTNDLIAAEELFTE